MAYFRDGNNLITIEQKEEIIKLSLQGLSNRKVASIVGCGKTIVQKLYKNYLEREVLKNENRRRLWSFFK